MRVGRATGSILHAKQPGGTVAGEGDCTGGRPRDRPRFGRMQYLLGHGQDSQVKDMGVDVTHCAPLGIVDVVCGGAG